MADESAPELPSSVELHFQKSNLFRVVHADGCYGGVTPRGHLHMAFYNERHAIPRRSELSIVDGQPGIETVVETKGGFVREVEVDVIMDINAAMAMYVWLGQKIEQMRNAVGLTEEEWLTFTKGLPK